MPLRQLRDYLDDLRRVMDGLNADIQNNKFGNRVDLTKGAEDAVVKLRAVYIALCDTTDVLARRS